MNEKKLRLTDLVDTKILQDIQDAFSDMTGMAALTTDSNGIAVTNGSNFTDFCMKYTRASKLGRPRCENCDKIGTQISHKDGRSLSYRCHAGLVDFAAPIIANGEIVGCFIGGQILVKPPYIPGIRETAAELGIDPDEYEAAVKKIPIVSQEQVEKAVRFLQVTASGLSDLAFKSYQLHESNLELEKVSHLKSDFLANMSHEIRTPMNAVIGLTDLALREEMPQAVREYLHQIKSAGKNLLVVINDILDFSKIESGKMDIVEAEYRALSIVQDLVSIVNSRLSGKNIEFTMDIPPDLPDTLYGDSARIHQILMALLTNAVKFTQQGEVHFKVEFELCGKDTVIMKASVRDTGIGIRKKDMSKIFNSFQQIDSKRNHNFEGTGLGLAISQNLLRLMGGKIRFESEYNKGSVFHIEIPQKLIGHIPGIPRLEKPVRAAVLAGNQYVRAQLIRDLSRIGAEYMELDADSSHEDFRADYLIVEKELFTDEVCDFVKSRPEMRCLVLVSYDSIEAVDIPNVRVISKPVYSLSLYSAMGIRDIGSDNERFEEESFPFAAPEAHILIVDDSLVNLTVASGLLEPLQMKIDTAQSAADAIEKIHNAKYDLIFMDHMMPGVDGVEATHIIRRLVPSYNDVPIIALTANAIGGVREMLISEGMSDFVAKPIDLKLMLSKLRKWLPKEKIVPVSEDGAPPAASDSGRDSGCSRSALDIKELNVKSALSMLGSEKLFWTVLEKYFRAIDKKSKSILEHKATERWRDYTVEVHSLKSTSRQIGADHLADMAAELEKAGNDKNIPLINEKTDGMIEEYLQLRETLSEYFAEVPAGEERLALSEEIAGMLDELQEALDNFDTLQTDEVIEKMSKFKYSDDDSGFFKRLQTAAADGDIDRCLGVVGEWRAAVAGGN